MRIARISLLQTTQHKREAWRIRLGNCHTLFMDILFHFVLAIFLLVLISSSCFVDWIVCERSLIESKREMGFPRTIHSSSFYQISETFGI